MLYPVAFHHNSFCHWD